MKVKELVSLLSKLDQGLDVYGYCEDESLQTEGKLFRVFFIDSADEQMAIAERKSFGEPTLAFDSGPGSRKLAFINMTTDF